MKKYFFFSAFLFSAVLFSQNKWSLEECIDHAKQHNIDIVKQLYLNEITDEDITIAKGSFLPDVTFSGTQNFSLGNSFNVSTGVGQRESRYNSFSLSSSISLFNGFLNKYQLEYAKLNAQKGALEIDKIGFDLSLNISNNYLQVLFNKEILLVAEEQKLISQSEVDRITKLYKVALRPKSEFLEIQSTFSSDSKEVIIAKNNVVNSLIELKELLDIKDIENFDIQSIDIKNTDFSSLTLDTDLEKVFTINPFIKTYQLNIDLSEKNNKIAKAKYYPRLNFNYSYGSNYYHIQGTDDRVFNQITNEFEDNGFLKQLDNNKTHYLGFSLTVPIFNKFLTKSNIDKSNIEKEIAQVELENIKTGLKNKIEIARNDLTTSVATYKSAKKAMEYQKEAFSIIQKKYKHGILSSYEFLEAKSKYIKTQSEFIKSKYDYLFKTKVLEYYLE